MKNIYVITGGTSGIGLATAKTMPKENSFATIKRKTKNRGAISAISLKNQP